MEDNIDRPRFPLGWVQKHLLGKEESTVIKTESCYPVQPQV